MSGETTVTPGKVWTAEDVDAAKLVSTATPTIQVDSDAITSRELSGPALLAAYADTFRRKNFFANAGLWSRYWQKTSTYLNCATGQWTENAHGWQVRPSGDVIGYGQLEATPADNPQSKFAIELEGYVSNTGAHLAQFFTGDIGSQIELEEYIAVSFRALSTNDAADDFTCYIYTCTTLDDFSTLAIQDQLDGGIPTAASDDWDLWEFGVDPRIVPGGLSLGFAIVIDIATSALNSATKHVSFAQLQFELATASSTYINPVNPEQGQTDYFIETSSPGTGHDSESYGVRAGSIWYDITTPAKPEIWLCISAAPLAANWQRVTTTIEEYFAVWETAAANVDGGSFTNGADRTRVLNNISPADSRWTVGSNQITLAAGFYRVEGTAPAFNCSAHAIHLYNVTDSSILLQGNNSFAGTTGVNGDFATINGFFYISATKVIELRHRCTTTRNTDGFGRALNVGKDEIYSHLVFHTIPFLAV